MIDPLIELLKANPRKLIFTEGTDARILEAAARLKQDGFLTPVLIGNADEVRAAAAKGGFDKVPCGQKLYKISIKILQNFLPS